MEDRDYDLCAHGDLANYAFTDYGKGALAERWFLEAFGQDEWAAGMQRYLDGCEAYLRQAADGAPFDRGTDPERLADIRILKSITVVLVPLLTALIVCLILRGKMKTARACARRLPGYRRPRASARGQSSFLLAKSGTRSTP